MKSARRVVASLITAVLALAPLAAQAIPVTWTLTDAVFVDGGTATGSFVYDADLNVLSDVNITTSGAVLAQSFAFVPPSFSVNATQFFAVTTDAADLTGAGQFFLNFDVAGPDTTRAPMTNAGGVLDITRTTSSEAVCATANCFVIFASPLRRFETGTIVGTPAAIPLPAGLPLLVAGLGGFALLRRRAAPA